MASNSCSDVPPERKDEQPINDSFEMTIGSLRSYYGDG